MNFLSLFKSLKLRQGVAYLLMVSCSSTTVIKTNDPEVNIYVDGAYLGKGSSLYTDKKISWLDTKVRMQKDGCQDEFAVFSKDETLDVLPFVTGFLFLLPFLWTMKYNAVHEYNYVCRSTLPQAN